MTQRSIEQRIGARRDCFACPIRAVATRLLRPMQWRTLRGPGLLARHSVSPRGATRVGVNERAMQRPSLDLRLAARANPLLFSSASQHEARPQMASVRALPR